MSDPLPPLDTLFAPLAGFARIGIAVSGGPDSLALMLLTAQWASAQKSPPQLFIYTVDHGLRAAGADEVAFVVCEAEKLGLRARALRWEGDKPKAGLQAAARDARYGLIGAAMRDDAAEVLVTAHHAHDQAETVLMRLAHGSGLGGLGGMAVLSEIAGVKVCRPLLGIAPGALADVVAQSDITPVLDPSNENTDFERVRWRRVLPVLSELDLGAGRVGLFAIRARRADDALRVIADDAFAAIAQIDSFGAVRIAVAALRDLSAELQVRIVRKALRLAGGGQRPFALQQVEVLAGALVGQDEFTKTTLLGCVIDLRDEVICFMREAARVPDQVILIAPGETQVWDDRFEVSNGLDTAIEVVSGGTLTRQQVEELLGRACDAPMASVHSAPVVRVGAKVIAIGSAVFDTTIMVRFTSSAV